jgi:hypothetical protein
MADWLTARQLDALARRYGTENPAEEAIRDARACSPEVARLWAARDAPIWRGDRDGWSSLFWPEVLRALGIVEALANDKRPAVAHAPTETHPRHRPPAQIAVETVKALKWQLAKRQEELAQQRPRGEREYTQEKIAERLGLDRNRVQRAEALQRLGWDLLRSHPDFAADDGFVRWPSPAEATRIRDSESAQN